MNSALIFGLVLAVLVLVAVRTLRAWNSDSADPFDFRDLLMENGRASRGAVVMLGAFAATTWFFIYYTLTGKMTEGYFGLYSAAWIMPVVARMLSGAPAASPKGTP